MNHSNERHEGGRPGREGFLTVHPRGFGFVASPGKDDDLFIPEEGLGGAMHGDFVAAVVVVRTRRGAEGRIAKVLKRANQRVAGILRVRGHAVWLDPDDSRIRGPVMMADRGSGKDGDAAVARITRFPDEARERPEGVIEAVLGTPGDPNVEVAKILVRDAVEEQHPAEAVAEAEAYGREVPREALDGREDLTHLPLPTIDPEDARDHDDAVWGRREADGSYTVWIAIADVSYYVRPKTALDQAAAARSCSIYLPDRAIPMLPRALSSHLCSLLPNELRLCMCVEAKLDATGAVTSYRVFEAFMRSAAKLTYGGVARALGFTSLPLQSPEAEAMRADLQVLQQVSSLLRVRRMRRGSLDFDLPEAKLVLDPTSGAPVSIERRTEDPGVKKAYQLIEDLMLLANELVAEFLTKHQVPTIYRVHGSPDEMKLERFANMAQTLGLAFPIDDAKDPKKLSRFLKKIEGHAAYGVFNMLLLRSMKQATYDTVNIGHFGLASPAYLHFTSPIRRYPDLVVHRTLRAVLRNERVDRSASGLQLLKDAAVQASLRERDVMDIEREVMDLYRALYMQRHIGETFDATVTGLVGSGVFVQLDSPFADVLIRFEALGRDEYQLDDDELRVFGARSGDVIALGDRLRVTIEDVAILRRTVYGRREGGPIVGADHPRRDAKGGARFGKGAFSTSAGGKAGARPTRDGNRPTAKGAKTGSSRGDTSGARGGTSTRGSTSGSRGDTSSARGGTGGPSGARGGGKPRPSSGHPARGAGGSGQKGTPRGNKGPRRGRRR